MIQTVTIRDIEIGAGMPKICVPIVEKTREEILATAQAFSEIPFDVVEWRGDWYEDVEEPAKVCDTLRELRKILGEKPILFTFRSSAEGGEKSISPEYYETLLVEAAASGYADLIDVEIFTGDDRVSRIITKIHDSGCKVIASNHDFSKTPDEEELIRRLTKMQDMQADIAKIAVMPQSRQDVLTLLSATERMNREYARVPIVTMSMGSLGLVSRLCGECFGSVLTFGAAGKVSAPGQMDASRLSQVLQAIHSSL